MYLLIAVINNEDLLNELLMGWLDMGITGSTVMESTDCLQMISHHVPIFAGFRSLTSGGMPHNKTLITAVETEPLLDQAIAYLESICTETRKPHQGVYFVAPLSRFGRLGAEVAREAHQQHMEKKIGRPIKGKNKP